MKAAIEAPAPVPMADGIWRVKFIPSREAHVLERRIAGERDGRPAVVQETYGARMEGPQGRRFSPMFIFREADAQEMADQMNRRSES